MDFYSLGFIFVIVMVSGVIAYLADIGGRKLGKQRLSIFGLRPRHTAAAATFVGGITLSILTIILVSLFFSPVRHWILDGTKALNALNSMNRQLVTLEDRLKSEKAEVEKAEREKQKTQSQILKYRENINDNEKTLGTQKTQIADEQKSIGSLKGIQIRLQDDLKQTRLSLTSKSQLIHTDEIKIDDTDRKLQKNRADLQLAKREYDESSKKYLDGNKALLGRNSKLTEDIGRQKTELSNLMDQRHTLVESVSGLQSDLEAKKEDLNKLNAQLENENAELASIQREDQFASYNAWLARVSPMVYRHLQEVCRVPEEANLSPEAAEAAIDSLVRRAQLEAQHHGAKSADIMPRPDGTTAEQIRALLKDQLTGKPDETVLIASASINTFVDEPVPLEITLAPNPTVYRRGEKIGECDVDGNGSNLVIEKQLQEFGARLRERAKKDKMIPQDEDSFGSLPADQVLDLVDEVKQAGRRVRLQALAAQDTHAADPLKLNFRIR